MIMKKQTSNLKLKVLKLEAIYCIDIAIQVNTILKDSTLSRNEKIMILSAMAQGLFDDKRQHDSIINSILDPYDDSNPVIASHQKLSEEACTISLGILNHMNRAIGTNVRVVDILS